MHRLFVWALDAVLGRPLSTSRKRWPSVDLAYGFVLPAYQWAQQRLDAVDSRIQTLQAFAASITIAAPVFAAAIVTDIQFDSIWFVLALGAFGITVVTGAIARAWGTVQIISPQRLYQAWLHLSEWEFKKNAIYWAGEHFETNRTLVNGKGWVPMGMTAAFLAEAVFLLIWIGREI